MSCKIGVEPNAIYSREEAAQMLGVSLATLKRLIRAGHLVVSQPAGVRRIFIKGSSILQMLEKTQRPQQNSQFLEHSRSFANGDSMPTPGAERLGSLLDESCNPSTRGEQLALRSKRASKGSPTFSRRAVNHAPAPGQGGRRG